MQFAWLACFLVLLLLDAVVDGVAVLSGVQGEHFAATKASLSLFSKQTTSPFHEFPDEARNVLSSSAASKRFFQVVRVIKID